MSIKVMIVDDEHLGRALVKLGTDWEANGFEIIGEADSGKSALEFMKGSIPDVLLTDICMPFMDGLELSERVRKEYPQVRIVIMTGHREFEYAQRAVKLGVTEFLLKPVNNEEIVNVLVKLRKDILEQREREREISSIRTQLDNSLPIVREHFINDLVHGKADKLQCPELIKKYGLEFVNGQVSCLYIKPCLNEQGEAVYGAWKRDVTAAAERMITAAHAGISTADGDVILLVDGCCSENDILALKETIKHAVSGKACCAATIGVSGRHAGVEGAACAYREAKEAAKARIIYGKDRIIRFEELDCLRQENSELLEGNWSEFAAFIRNGIEDKAREYIHNYILWISGTGSLDIQIIRLLCTNVVTISITVLNEMGKKLTQVFPEGYDVFNEISRVDTLEDMEELLRYFVSEIINYIKAGKEKKTCQLVDEAKKYIQEHLCESDLSLKKIAKSLYVNESYLSRVFKAEAGENVTEYVLKLRIGKALKYLNETSLKVYEISELIGFSDSHYFGICFKKYTGKSVNEYKKGNFK